MQTASNVQALSYFFCWILFMGSFQIAQAQCTACDNAWKQVVYEITHSNTTNSLPSLEELQRNYLSSIDKAANPLDTAIALPRYRYTLHAIYNTWSPETQRAFTTRFSDTANVTTDRILSFVRDQGQQEDEQFVTQLLYTNAWADLKLANIKPIGSDSVRIQVTKRGSQLIQPNLYLDDKKVDSDPQISGAGYTWTIPGKSDAVYTVDQDYRYADPNRLNNASYTPLSLSFNALQRPEPTLDSYQLTWRPDAWYNGYDGVKLGLRLKGAYALEKHQLDIGLLANTGLAQNRDYGIYENDYDPVSFWVTYNTRTHWFATRSDVYADARYLDGLQSIQTGLRIFTRSGKSDIHVNYKLLYRSGEEDLLYLIYPEEWLADRLNTSVTVELSHRYRYSTGEGTATLGLRSAAFAADYDYQSIYLDSKHTYRLWKLPFHSRLFGQYGSGMNWARESRLFLAGANPESLMGNPFTRSNGIIPTDWEGYGNEINHFQASGGLNLRGYAGYQAFTEEDGSVIPAYVGETGVAVNGELDLQELIPLNTDKWNEYVRYRLYLFGDAGVINVNQPGQDLEFADLRADAGIGTAVRVLQWGKFNDLQPVSLRFDVPLWINRPPSGEDYIAFRWQIGFSTLF